MSTAPAKALVVIDHGSRNPKAHEELEQLVSRLQAAQDIKSPATWTVRGAHLELRGPKIEEVVGELYQEGLRNFTILPWFLASGRHLNEDIPELYTALQATYQDASFELKNHLGAELQLIDLAWKIVED